MASDVDSERRRLCWTEVEAEAEAEAELETMASVVVVFIDSAINGVLGNTSMEPLRLKSSLPAAAAVAATGTSLSISMSMCGGIGGGGGGGGVRVHVKVVNPSNCAIALPHCNDTES